MKLSLNYQQLDDVAALSPTVESGAELHGMLTGFLCRHENLSLEHWVDLAFDASGEDLTVSEWETLRILNTETREALAEEDFSFDLVLPEDHVDLPERAKALGFWCQGYLFGLGAETAGEDISEDALEVIGDLVRISQLDPESGSESDEQALMELTEFVRVCVQLLRRELISHNRPQRLH
jgi:uncharacterized protein YgfB (UPF0149 family)